MILFNKDLHKKLYDLRVEIAKIKHENEEYQKELSNQVILNLCDECLPDAITGEDILLQDTGDCDKCKNKGVEVIDLDLIAYYRSLGLQASFIFSHLPRLRKYRHNFLSFDDIHSIVSEKLMITVN